MPTTPATACRLGSARTRCGMPARPATTSAAWILVAIQQMLGHWHVGTTMRYVTPSATFIEDAYRRAISGTLIGAGRRLRCRLGGDCEWPQPSARSGPLHSCAGYSPSAPDCDLSSASVSALFTKQPAQVKLETLLALCTALECTPNDLFEVDTTPVGPRWHAGQDRSPNPRPPAAARCRRCDQLSAPAWTARLR